MTEQTKSEGKAGLAILRGPFAPELISKLPKPTKAQTDAVKADYKAGMRCTVCGTWHHKDVAHLDYVGHAALTDRLLDADPEWNWEPVKTNEDGTPALDKDGGMWIKLTVCGVTRLGYGDAQDKTGANAVKERIGDALRNAAMRFGAALDLWSKADIHFDEHETFDLLGWSEKIDAAENRPVVEYQYLEAKKEAVRLNDTSALKALGTHVKKVLETKFPEPSK